MSKEYIEREAAIEWVKSLIDTMSVCTSIDECLGMKSMKGRALGALHDIPAADVVELPCKVGTKVWFVKTSGIKPEIIETEVEKIGVKKSGMYIKLLCNSMYETAISAIGRSVFFQKKGAEEKMDRINDERLFKVILQGLRDSGSEGLYSFLVGIGGGGTAYVECRCGEVFVRSVTFCEGKEKTERFVGTAISATNFLLLRDADFSTISNSCKGFLDKSEVKMDGGADDGERKGGDE